MAIVEAVRNGAYITDIARYYGISKQRVSRLAILAGIRPRSRPLKRGRKREPWNNLPFVAENTHAGS